MVGGDAEIGGCSTGVYLQVPDYNNGRADCDGRGIGDSSNIDVNAPYALYTATQMAFSGVVSCDDVAAVPSGISSVGSADIYPNPVASSARCRGGHIPHCRTHSHNAGCH